MKKILFFLPLFLFIQVAAQNKNTTAWSKEDSTLISKVKYRLVGPFRGGRSAAVSGSHKNKNTYYFGATGGGVWKTTDAGSNWKNVSDKYFGGSIGAVSIAPSDEDIVYVGEGENTIRGNVSEGLGGMWRSDDAGRTWKNIGLKDGRHIIRIVIHPKDPNTVWVAVLGHAFGPNEMRGIYKTVDGGKNWRRVLYVNNQAGTSDLVMEPGNPSVLYAGTWRMIRTPYSLESGGEGSGLWKSVDGGENWTNITSKKGLPKGAWGIVGVAVAPSNPDKIYALIENANGGMYASADGGETWALTSSDNNIRQRAWYYTKVFVDPKNENTVYAPNVNLMRSRDGGRTFQSMPTPHGDHHDMWIDPENPSRMIVADDGGGYITFDGGANWSSIENQPTAQFYRVSTDNSFPYRILGAQQDNSTVRIKSRTTGAAITQEDWDETAGGESGFVVADPLNPDVVYGGSYGGLLQRLDHRTNERRTISPWPNNPMGAGADALQYRFQWNFPIFFSPHNPKRLYAAANVLFASENEGASWEQISPDLTTDDKSKQASSGGLITKDNTSVEYYSTIFAATESPFEKDLLWTGSDDGLIFVSKDAGKNWENVTPPNAPKWMMWNNIEPDPFKKGAAYFVGTRYKLDDYTPYIYKTEDYGKTWRLLTSGINKMHFTRALRADKRKPGLLYVGTEFGMYISYNDGASWKPFQLNLPIVPITDLAIKENDLIVATQGRAFWVIDDLTVVQEVNPNVTNKALHIFPVEPAYRMQGGRSSFGANPTVRNAGTNAPIGAIINFYASNVNDSTKAAITILDKDRKELRTFSTDAKENARKIDVTKGMNQFVWNMNYADVETVEGMIFWTGTPGSLLAIPGTYYARVKVGRDSTEVPFIIKADPNYKTTQAEYEQKGTFLKTVLDKFNETQKAIKDIRSLRSQINDFVSRQGKDVPKEIKASADSINKNLTDIEEALYQTKARSGQDVLNYPIRLNNKLSYLFNVANTGNTGPSKQARDLYADLASQIDVQLTKFKTIKEKDIPAFNELVRQKALPIIGVK